MLNVLPKKKLHCDERESLLYQFQFKPACRRMLTLRENMIFSHNGRAVWNENPYYSLHRMVGRDSPICGLRGLMFIQKLRSDIRYGGYLYVIHKILAG
jgi:hypothetical protein